MIPKTPSGMNEKGHANRPPEAKNIENTTEEIAYTQEISEGEKYEALLSKMCGDERWRLSKFRSFLKQGGKALSLIKEVGGFALSYGGKLKDSILPHYFKGGMFEEFVKEIKEQNKTLIYDPIKNMLKNKEKIQALIGNLKAGDLTDFETKSLYESIAKHQENCAKYPTEKLDDVDKRYESCKAARDKVKSLIDKYESKFADSHLLRGLYQVYDEEFKHLEKNRENLQDRKKIWDKSIERRKDLDSSGDELRGYYDDFQKETDRTKKDKIRDSQHKYITETYEKKYNLLKESIEEQIKFLLELAERKKSLSPASYHPQIEKNVNSEIIRLREGLKPYMADLGINIEHAINVDFKGVNGNPLTFHVVKVELQPTDKSRSKRIP